MAVLPDNLTARYWVKYHSNGREHEAMFRLSQLVLSDATAFSAFVFEVGNLFTEIRSFLPTDFRFLTARISEEGSNLSMPGPVPPAVTGTGIIQQGEAPAYLTFVGRTQFGVKWRLHILGITQSAAGGTAAFGNYRVEQGEHVDVDAAITLLAGWADLQAADGSKPIIYPYANTGYNAYWQRRMRG